MHHPPRIQYRIMLAALNTCGILLSGLEISSTSLQKWNMKTFGFWLEI